MFSILVTAVALVIAQQAAGTSEDLSQIIISPEDVLVFPGQTLLVPCVAYIHSNNTSHATIAWNKDGVALESDSRITTLGPMESDRDGVLFVRVVLEVCDVGVGDTGQYSCALNVNGVEKDTADFEITVSSYDAPTQIILAPEDIEVAEDQTVLLTCVAMALPSPTITWTQNGHNLTQAASSETATAIHSDELVVGGVRMVRSVLEMCNVQGLASGQFACVAENGLSSSNAGFKVMRKAPIQLFSGPQSTSVHVGTNISLTCDFHSSPRPTVWWSGVPLTSGGRFIVHESIKRDQGVEFVRSVLSVSPVAEYDGGVIECGASNGVDQLKHSFDLSVIVPPQIIVSPSHVYTTTNHLHQTLTLACISLGANTLTWQRGGLELTTDPRLSITDTEIARGGRTFALSLLEVCALGVDDSGEYSCVASSGEERDVSNFDVCLYAPTGLLVAPSDVAIVTDHTLSIPCVAYTTVVSAPTTRVSWTSNNAPLVNSSKFTIFESREERGGVVLIRSILLVSCVEPQDTAQYACHVTSDDITESAEFTVSVQVPPQIKEVPDHTHSTGKDGTVSITCLVSGDPLPLVSWLKDNSPIQPDLDKRVEIRQTTVPGFDSFDEAVESVITITSVTEGDAGVYNCQAVSEIGIAELSYRLIVDPTINTGEVIDPVSMGIGHASYIGTIIGFVCFMALFTVYISIRLLREGSSTPALINLSVSLMALNLSFVLSYNTIHTGDGCIFFSSLFHYLFLSAMLAVTNFVVLKFKLSWTSTKQKLIAHLIAFSLNWGIPIPIVVVALAPDVSNYAGSEASHFCGPMLWPYWLGELLPFGVIHLPTWCVFFLIAFINKSKQGLSCWLRDSVSTALTLLLFDIAWGIGLPSTQQTNTILQSLFLVFSTLLGLIPLVFYCLLCPEARFEIIKIMKRGCISKSQQTTPTNNTTTEPPSDQPTPSVTNPAVTNLESSQDFSLSGIEAAKELLAIQEAQELSVSRQPRGIITSFSESITEEDLDLDESGRANGPGSVPRRHGSVTGPQVVNVYPYPGVHYAMVEL